MTVIKPPKGYSVFAGKDSSKALGKSSLEPSDCVGDYSGLTAEEVVWWILLYFANCMTLARNIRKMGRIFCKEISRSRNRKVIILVKGIVKS